MTDTSRQRRTILTYSTVMAAAVYFPSPAVGLFIIPLSFLLKNKLNLSANELATLTLWAGIPAYFSFVFGIVRDYWSPLRLGDRGYFILFGTLSALLFAGFAFAGASETTLFANALISTMI